MEDAHACDIFTFLEYRASIGFYGNIIVACFYASTKGSKSTRKLEVADSWTLSRCCRWEIVSALCHEHKTSQFSIRWRPCTACTVTRVRFNSTIEHRSSLTRERVYFTWTAKRKLRVRFEYADAIAKVEEELFVTFERSWAGSVAKTCYESVVFSNLHCRNAILLFDTPSSYAPGLVRYSHFTRTLFPIPI